MSRGGTQVEHVIVVRWNAIIIITQLTMDLMVDSIWKCRLSKIWKSGLVDENRFEIPALVERRRGLHLLNERLILLHLERQQVASDVSYGGTVELGTRRLSLPLAWLARSFIKKFFEGPAPLQIGDVVNFDVCFFRVDLEHLNLIFNYACWFVSKRI